MNLRYICAPLLLPLLLLTALAQNTVRFDQEPDKVAEILNLAANQHKEMIDHVGALKNKADSLKTRIAELKTKAAAVQPKLDAYNNRVATHNAHQPDPHCDPCVADHNADLAADRAERSELQEAMAPLLEELKKLRKDTVDFSDSLQFRDAVVSGSNSQLTFDNHSSYQLRLYVDGNYGCTADPGASCMSTESKAQHLEAKLGEQIVIERTLTAGTTSWIVCSGTRDHPSCR